MSDLRVLKLDLPGEALIDLEALGQLELIVLQSDLFEKEPGWIDDLKTKLPNTRVVPGSGLCLGSGWLLLLLPFILISRYAFRWSK